MPSHIANIYGVKCQFHQAELDACKTLVIEYSVKCEYIIDIKRIKEILKINICNIRSTNT